MRRRAVDLFLLLAILAGGSLAWTTGRERSRLTKEHDRLARAMGNLTIGDPTQVHVVALDTGEPLHFAWRVYFPANYPAVLKTGNGVLYSALSNSPVEAIMRVRFREDEHGLLNVYTRGSGGSSRRGVGDKSLADLLRGRWGEIKVEQMGTEGVALIKPDEQVSLLKLTLPEPMQEEAKTKLSGRALQSSVPTLYELKLGTAKP